MLINIFYKSFGFIPLIIHKLFQAPFGMTAEYAHPAETLSELNWIFRHLLFWKMVGFYFNRKQKSFIRICSHHPLTLADPSWQILSIYVSFFFSFSQFLDWAFSLASWSSPTTWCCCGCGSLCAYLKLSMFTVAITFHFWMCFTSSPFTLVSLC